MGWITIYFYSTIIIKRVIETFARDRFVPLIFSVNVNIITFTPDT